MVPKDLEGVSDPVVGHESSSTAQQPAAAEPASTAGAKRKTTRQKRIAVLTSGGDSAGMNAAGQCTLTEIFIGI